MISCVIEERSQPLSWRASDCSQRSKVRWPCPVGGELCWKATWAFTGVTGSFSGNRAAVAAPFDGASPAPWSSEAV